MTPLAKWYALVVAALINCVTNFLCTVKGSCSLFFSSVVLTSLSYFYSVCAMMFHNPMHDDGNSWHFCNVFVDVSVKQELLQKNPKLLNYMLII